MIESFLFDLDDTLIETKIYRQIYPEVVKRLSTQLKISETELFLKVDKLGLKKNKYGNYDSGELSKSFKQLNLYYSILETAIKINKSLHDNVLEVFSSLKNKGKRIGIVSNSMHRTIELYIQKYQLKVDFVFSSDDAGCNKDQERYWKRLIKKEKLTPKNCLVIGDNLHEDVEVPSSLGFKTFYLDNVKKLKEVLMF